VDITVNNRLAVVNTKLLRDYAAIDPRLRNLVLLVKHWWVSPIMCIQASADDLVTATAGMHADSDVALPTAHPQPATPQPMYQSHHDRGNPFTQ
jgi:hypothetical protein